MNTIQTIISEYATEHNVSAIRARMELVKNKTLAEFDAKAFADKTNLTLNQSRYMLNKMVKTSGSIMLERVIIGNRVSKRSAKSKLVPVYGNLYIIINNETVEKML